MPANRLPRHRRAAVTARDRAIRRVSRLTVAVALAGTAASVGFAALAAETYTGGTPATNARVSQPQTSATTPQTVTAPIPIQVAQPPSRSTGRARVTAGGSG